MVRSLALALWISLAGCDVILRLDEVPAPAQVGIAYVQGTYNASTDMVASVQAAYHDPQRAGDLDVLVISWFSPGSLASVTDSVGNTYSLAGMTSTQAIYYAPNIHAAPAMTNQVSVSFDLPIFAPDLRILEYTGIATASPLDGYSGRSGNSTDLDSGPLTTQHAYDLLVAGNTVEHITDGNPDPFENRLTTNNSQIAEDEIVTGTGTYDAMIQQVPGGIWVMAMAAFKGASNAPPS